MDTVGTTAIHFNFPPELLDDARFPAAALQIPSHLELRDDNLYWAWHRFESDWPAAGVSPFYVNPKGLLDRFIAIRSGPDVVKFARRYGVLGICEHGVPASHNTPFVEPRGCEPLHGDDGHAIRPYTGLFRESIDDWIGFVYAANAILHLAAALHRGDPSRRKEWRFAWQVAWHPGREEDKEQLLDGLDRGKVSPKALLATIVNLWLSIGNAGVTLEWPSGHAAPGLRLSTGVEEYVPATFGVLAGQLMLAVARAQEMLICTGCGRPYIREKRYQPRRWKGINFCPTCHAEGVPNKLRARRKRAKA